MNSRALLAAAMVAPDEMRTLMKARRVLLELWEYMDGRDPQQGLSYPALKEKIRSLVPDLALRNPKEEPHDS